MQLKNKRVLASGFCGFIGNEMTRQVLSKNPSDFIVIDKMSYMSDDTFHKKNNILVHKIDICSEETLNLIAEFKPDIILHMAAESHVDVSIKDPDAFVRANVFGTTNLMNAALKLDNLELFYHCSCYDTGTRAITLSGYKRYDEISVEDMVLTIDPETSKTEWKKVEKVIIQPYSGDMINFKTRSLDLMVTPNHRMIVRDRDTKLKWYTAEEQSERYEGTIPLGVTSAPETGEDNDILFLIGVYIGDGHTYHDIVKRKNKTGLTKIELNDLRDKKTGRFIPGLHGTNEYSLCNSYRTFFEVPEDDKCRIRLESSLDRLNIKYSKYKKNIYVGGKKWHELFLQFGTGAFNKNIPEKYLKLSKSELQAIFDGLMLSDGCKTTAESGSTHFMYTTVSDILAAQVAAIGSQLGWKVTSRITTNKRSSVINGREIPVGPANYVLFTNSYENGIGKYSAKRTTYSGNVWCLKVADNKNFLVERNGRFAFCGNTDEVTGDKLIGESKEDDPRLASSPYSASKASAELFVESYGRTFELPYLITRSSNNYGPHQHYEKLIPKVIQNILDGKKIPVYTPGNQMRQWIHVKDNCEGIISAIENYSKNDVFNIGGSEVSVNLNIIKQICVLMNVDPNKFIEYVTDRPGHDTRYCVAIDKIKAHTGWAPKISLEDGLRDTIEWYRSR